MKTLDENDGCRFALTEPEAVDQGWSHLRLGTGPGLRTKTGAMVGGGAYRHQFCAEPVQPGSVYCPAHHARCYRGPGKDARSLEEMIYAIDQSQHRGRPAYAEHTDPTDIELARGKPEHRRVA